MATEKQKYRKVRPVNLNLWTIHFPITAIASILHRLSGIVLFLAVPLLVWGLDASLASPDSFASVQSFLTKPFIKLILWLFLTALIYHLFAGLRHFVMDFGWGESLSAGKISAAAIILLSLVFSVLLGIYLW